MDVEEQLAFFDCQGVFLSGILTIPPSPNGRAVLMPWGAGAFPSSARNRIRTRLAWALADQGFHSFRFDYPGVGESDGDYQEPTLASPYIESILAACQWLHGRGLSRIVVLANCFGAWSSLLAAPQISDLQGLMLINCPVGRDHTQSRAAHKPWRWWWSHMKQLRLWKLRHRERRARYRKMVTTKAGQVLGVGPKPSKFTEAVDRVIADHIPLLLIYGPDGFRPDFEAEMQRGLRARLEAAVPPTRFDALEDRVEGFSKLASQFALMDIVQCWLVDLVSTAPHKVTQDG